MDSVSIEMTKQELETLIRQIKILDDMGLTELREATLIKSKLEESLSKIKEVEILKVERDRYRKALESIEENTPNADDCYRIAKESLEK